MHCGPLRLLQQPSFHTLSDRLNLSGINTTLCDCFSNKVCTPSLITSTLVQLTLTATDTPKSGKTSSGCDNTDCMTLDQTSNQQLLKWGFLYLGNATAAARAVLPILPVCAVFACPSGGVTTDV